MTNQTAILITVHCAVSVVCKLVEILYCAGVISFRERTNSPKIYTGNKMYLMYIKDFLTCIIPLINIIRLFTLFVAVWGNLRYPAITDMNRIKFYHKEEVENK